MRTLEQILNYVKPELLIVAVVLYFIGMGIKKSETISDKYIPAILGVLGVVICGIYVIATCSISSGQEIAMAIFTAITQGILVAGLSNYVNQIIKQASKEE
nr:MAG TPA: holin [Caudoviricetes sp.]